MALQTHTSILVLAAIASTASAGMLNRSVFRQPIVTIDNHTRSYVHEAGDQPAYDTFDVALTHTNEVGSSTSKSTFESFSSENYFKISSDCSIHTQQGTPGEYFLARLSSSISFDLNEETDFDLRHRLIDQSMNELVLLEIFIVEYTPDTNRVYEFEARSGSAGTDRVTLGPGSYRMFVRNWLIRDLSETPGVLGESQLHATAELRVVPTPTTLAMISPLGILATRRRR